MVKKYRVILPRRARKSIREIEEYVKKDSLQNAQNVRKAIIEKAKSLKAHPNRFSKFQPLHTESQNQRSVAVWDFIIIYEVIENKNLVIVDDVFHGAQDK